MPSVASVAHLLLTLLPAGTPNVPAPLRYTIARGLEDVEAPPFKSLDEFSTVLERFEEGASRDVLRRVVQRAARPTLVARRPPASSSEPRQPIAAAPPMFGSFGADGEAASPQHSLRRWALAAAALVASFAVGFAVVDGITDRRAATQPSGSTRV